MSISTHVLDTARGRPATGVPVRLERRAGDGWTLVASGSTGADGRLALTDDATAGVHRLTFDVATDFFPQVTVQFTIADAGHYHVPLLLSPYGYSTYRGS